MDMLFGIIGFALGYAIAKNSKSDPTEEPKTERN